MKQARIYIAVLALAAATTSLFAAESKDIWENKCAKCHGLDGKGEKKLGKNRGVKDLTDAKYQASFSDEQAFKIIKEGLKDGQKRKMKPADGMTNEEIKGLVSYVRTLKK